VIDSVWESESFVGLGNFTFMADISTTVIYKASGLPPDEANVQQNGGKSGHYVN
jgi:hypothetical protein